MRTLYRIDDYQETYVVLDGVEAWPALDLDRLIPLWRDLDGQSDLDPGTLLPEDRVLARGTGAYHREKADRALRQAAE
jgi:phenylalanine-4-hydroxylase